MKKYTSIAEYIENFPPEVQVILEKMRATIRQVAPQSQEAIAYGIPTFRLNGNLVHFAGYAHHVGFYPGAQAIEVFASELTKYTTSKGTIQFQLSEPIPYELIKKITKYRASQNLQKKT